MAAHTRGIEFPAEKIKSYFERIRLPEAVRKQIRATDLGLETLTAICKAHVQTIPFENLDLVSCCTPACPSLRELERVAVGGVSICSHVDSTVASLPTPIPATPKSAVMKLSAAFKIFRICQPSGPFCCGWLNPEKILNPDRFMDQPKPAVAGRSELMWTASSPSWCSRGEEATASRSMPCWRMR